jgi:hypothetical protein
LPLFCAAFPHSAEAAARRPNGLRYSRDLVWVPLSVLGEASFWLHHGTLNSPTPTTMLSYFSSHSSLLPSEPITFAPQHRGIQCKHGAFSTTLLPLPFLVASPLPLPRHLSSSSSSSSSSPSPSSYSDHNYLGCRFVRLYYL